MSIGNMLSLRPLTRTIVLAAIVPASIAFAPLYAHAAVACNGNPGGFAAAFTQPGSGFANGGRADIERTTIPDLGTPASGTFAWSYVDMFGTSSGFGTAYMGFELTNAGTNNLFNFYAWQRLSTSPLTLVMFGTNPALGSSHTYSVNRYATDGDIHFLFDGTDIVDTNWDPHNAWGGSAIGWVDGGDNGGDDIWGPSNDHQNFGNTDYKNSSDNWGNPSYTSTSTLHCWANISVNTSGQEFHAWTDPSNHVC